MLQWLYNKQYEMVIKFRQKKISLYSIIIFLGIKIRHENIFFAKQRIQRNNNEVHSNIFRQRNIYSI